MAKLGETTAGNRGLLGLARAEARVLAGRLIAECFPGTVLGKDADGRPRVFDATGREAGFISISHSRDLVAVGAARHPIGIDVEKMDEARLDRSGAGLLQALSDRIEGTATITRPNFYSAWTLYEAALKSGASFKDMMMAPGYSVVAQTLRLAERFVFSLVLRQTRRDYPPGG